MVVIEKMRVHAQRKWESGFVIKVCIADNTATISANKNGLVSLANQLNYLAGEESIQK